MAKTIQDQLAAKITAHYLDAEVKKINKDNYLDIHLPAVHPKRGTHLFFNTASGVIKVGFYCREEEFTQEILAKSPELEAYSQGIRPKGNPEWKTVDAACAAAISFVESLSGKATPSSSTSATGNLGSKFLQRIKAAYPKCSVNEEKGYASFTFKAAFLYELRIQKGSIRLLAANYPQKASVAKSLELIARHQLAQKSVQDRYSLLVEPGKVSPDKLTVRIEIPYQASDLQNENFISQVIACCEQFHSALMPLINGFQSQPIGKLQEVMSDGSAPKSSGMEKETAKKETPPAPASQEDALTDFDLTEFDLEGRPIGRKEAPKAPPKKEAENPALDLNTFLSNLEMEGEPTNTETPTADQAKENPEAAQFDESDRCLYDPRPFLTCIQLIRYYFLTLSSGSKNFRASYEETLREFTKAAVVPRVSNDTLRIIHENGVLLEPLLLGPMLQAEERYDKDYATNNEYISSLGEVVSELMTHCNVGLFLDTLELFMYLGDMLEEEDSPTGTLAPQDRYFILFLMLKASPEQDLENLEMVLNKGVKSRNAKNGCDVKSLLLKASGNFGQLSNEEKLALMLYDFILWDEGPGLDIKVGDIAATKSIFTKVTQNAALGNQLLGGFNDNDSFEIFQFFNVEFNREGFHQFCLERWKELSSEWNALKLQLLIEGVRRDFHPSTYINNPVLDDYLKVFEGVKVSELIAVPSSPIPVGEKKIKTVQIGNQTWMVENLNTEFFANGDLIPHAETEEEWAEASQNFEPAWCYYDNDPENGKKYGRLYNWYAVNDPRGLAPDGWRIPSEDEFNSLFSFIEEDDEVNDFKLKCAEGWGPDSDATNETGFTALPGGYRNDSDGFIGVYDMDCPEDSYAAWWSASEIEGDPVMAAYRGIEYEFDGYTMFWESDKGTGYAVRCIKE